jgi:hypothetical protein
MQTIKRYPVHNATGEISIRMPAHCVVLGITDQSLAVAGDHNPERLVPKKFFVFLESEDVGLAMNHRYLGVLKRLDSFGAPYDMHVFEQKPPEWIMHSVLP